MTKTLIRHAVSRDFASLLEIDQSSFPAGVAYDSTELAYFINREGAETLVLEASSGEIAAFLIIEIDCSRRFATLVTLDVRAAFRRKGYASQLLQRAEEILNDYGVIQCDLQVDVANASAIELYKQHGFQIARLLRRYYTNGDDAFLMIKRWDRSSSATK